MSRLRLFCLIAAASFSGVYGSELQCRSIAFRDVVERLFGRGRLVAIENDDFSTASDLVAAENLRQVARNEAPDATRVHGEVSLLRAQFDNDRAFFREVRSNGFSMSSLRM